MAYQPVNSASAATPQTGAAILDAFVPSYSVLFRFLSSYFHIDNSSYLLIVVVLLAVTRSLWSQLLANYLTTSVEICSDDELFTDFRDWESEKNYSGKSSFLRAETRTRNDLPWYTKKDDRKDDDALNQQKIHYRFIGKIWLIRGLRIFWITRSEDSSSPSLWDTGSKKITISCIPGSQDAVKGLIYEIRQARLKRNREYVSVYINRSTSYTANWELQCLKKRRDVSTVVVDPEQKKKLLDAVENYLKPETRKWYEERGLLDILGILLWGPPGTGKSSMVRAIASIFGLPVYILNLGSITEQQLIELAGKLPRRCILLVEDIDCSGISRKHEASSTYVKDRTRVNESQSAFPSEKEPQPPSLAALLNVIDGVWAPEVRLLFVTTNNPEGLPDSLSRPGRIDIMVSFGYANKGIAEELFRIFYRTSVEESSLKLLSQEFASNIPENEFSPAAIQNYLLGYRECPEEAAKGARNWVKNELSKRPNITLTVPA
ncbi:hypothetical protein VTN49DRAFT_5426 [Thermomyces lanuginosus]|uniref:uncharacterized protein n=1 Tax=Thermomyces lanuginosus TaxID=5541 RepID=UPI003744579A